MKNYKVGIVVVIIILAIIAAIYWHKKKPNTDEKLVIDRAKLREVLEPMSLEELESLVADMEAYHLDPFSMPDDARINIEHVNELYWQKFGVRLF